MIDTVKLSIELPKPLKNPLIPFNHPTYYNGYYGPIRAHLNTSKSDRKFGLYRPSFTYCQNPKGLGFARYVLLVELSLPKAVNGNNFVELSDSDLGAVVKEIQGSLKTLGLELSYEHIASSEAVKVDYAKNVPLYDHTPVSSVVNDLMAADISRVYDVTKTTYRNGGKSFCIHTNSEELIVYDKIADLQKAKVSDKRAIENDNHTQSKLLDKLTKTNGLSVVRLEVRLNGKKKIRRSLADAGVEFSDLSLQALFSTNIAQKVLINSWGKLIDTIPKTPLYDDNPLALLSEIVEQQPGTSSQKALAKLGEQWLMGVKDTRRLRNVYDNHFGKHSWGRQKNSRAPPTARQLKTLLYIASQLEDMKPVGYADFGL